MLFENTLFSIIKNRKQKTIFGYQTYFLFFCSREQISVLKNSSQTDLKHLITILMSFEIKKKINILTQKIRLINF